MSQSPAINHKKRLIIAMSIFGSRNRRRIDRWFFDQKGNPIVCFLFLLPVSLYYGFNVCPLIDRFLLSRIPCLPLDLDIFDRKSLFERLLMYSGPLNLSLIEEDHGLCITWDINGTGLPGIFILEQDSLLFPIG